jgi:hypothetical protein
MHGDGDETRTEVEGKVESKCLEMKLHRPRYSFKGFVRYR